MAAPRPHALDNGTIAQQPFRPISKWTLRDLEAIKNTTEEGIYTLLGDFAASLYTDYQVRTAFDQRVLGLQSLPLVFESELDHKELREAFWRIFPAAEIAKAHRWALSTGVAIFYMRPTPRLSARDPWMPRAEAWNPRWYRYRHDLDRWEVTTYGLPGSSSAYNQILIEPDDPNWLIVRPYGANRPWAEALHEALGFIWIVKRFAVFDRSRHSEVLGSPVRAGIAPQGSTQRQREKWQNLLQRMGRDSAFVLPPGYDLKLIEGSGKGELYEQQILWADQASSKLLTGQTITTDGKNMGFGEGTIFENVKLDFIKFDARFWFETLTPWFNQWSLTNTGKGSSVSINTEPPKTLESRAAGIGALGDAVEKANSQLIHDDLRVDAAKLYADAGVPLVPSKRIAPVEKHHLEFGLVTKNEARGAIGLDPVEGGDETPEFTGQGTVAPDEPTEN